MSSLNVRVINTHDTQSNWEKCTTFVPRAGEIIVYDIDENYNYERFKIGDGKQTIVQLPFVVESTLISMFNINNNVVLLDGGRISQYEPAVMN